MKKDYVINLGWFDDPWGEYGIALDDLVLERIICEVECDDSQEEEAAA